MTHKTTITDNYILITSDEEVKFDDWVYNLEGVLFQYGIEHTLHPSTKKVIAHLPLGMYGNLEGVTLLPPLPSGEDDVEKLAEIEYPIFDGDLLGIAHNQKHSRIDFINGYNKAKEKYRFTEEDMRIAIRLATTSKHDATLIFFSEKEIIQSFSQPKMPTSFYPNMVCDQCNGDESTDSCYCHHGSYKIVPQIINGVMQGEWIY